MQVGRRPKDGAWGRGKRRKCYVHVATTACGKDELQINEKIEVHICKPCYKILIYPMCKELLQSNNKNYNSPMGKCAKGKNI